MITDDQTIGVVHWGAMRAGTAGEQITLVIPAFFRVHHMPFSTACSPHAWRTSSAPAWWRSVLRPANSNARPAARVTSQGGHHHRHPRAVARWRAVALGAGRGVCGGRQGRVGADETSRRPGKAPAFHWRSPIGSSGDVNRVVERSEAAERWTIPPCAAPRRSR